jgi:hypothetical protein
MTAIESWSWESPTSYWTPFFGNALILPNGDVMGVFGSSTHQFSENQPWTFNNTGAIIVEVNTLGQIVRTYTFPAGWGIYRVQEISSQNSFLPWSNAQAINPIIIASIVVAAIVISTVSAIAYLKRKRHRNKPAYNN